MNLKFWKKKEPAPRKDARTFKVGGGWGDAIQWMDYKTGSVSGHETPRPEVGDVLTCEMESGRTGVFLFAEVRPCYDPPDMFFATVQAMGYATELSWPLPPAARCDSLGGYRAKESRDAFYGLRAMLHRKP